MKRLPSLLILAIPFLLVQTSFSLAQSPDQLKTAYKALSQQYNGAEKIQHHKDQSGIILTFIYKGQPGFARYNRQLKWLGTCIQLEDGNIPGEIKAKFLNETDENPAQIVKIDHTSGGYYAVYGGEKSLNNLGNSLPENGVIAAMNTEVPSKFSLGSYSVLQEFPVPFAPDYQHFLVLFYTKSTDPVPFGQIQTLLKKDLVPFPNQFPGLPWFQEIAWMPGVNWTP